MKQAVLEPEIHMWPSRNKKVHYLYGLALGIVLDLSEARTGIMEVLSVFFFDIFFVGPAWITLVLNSNGPVATLAVDTTLVGCWPTRALRHLCFAPCGGSWLARVHCCWLLPVMLRTERRWEIEQ
jgi:hypothetical protein